ncbi:bifunctional metallophosphatase/5'-nucleotidase [Paenibacillus sp. J31TS4]|uniref:bifunctional metallophosphatase/5'-nucleotidase n=1 Tax=Paenibacillus sp. J31TS4 TaxID=2807195 RepID=UPI001B0ED11E|nr:bifunctional UDP-sugar hydrolase/5'-nucleotidase [Paenibacillus sp. J31TS4]GIP38278.1 bifunctional metallophosphatase/5'-nucleotidase [Paenibacillus sp. J31TS4]
MSGNPQQFVLLHTNDIHSHFEQMPKLAGGIRRLRSQYPAGRVLTVDLGDHADRVSPITDGTDGLANIAVLNAVGCDLHVPGNNEGLTFPLEVLDRNYGQEAAFTVLACNLAMEGREEPPSWLQASAIREVDGLRVGFIGATAAYPDFYSLLGWQIDEPLEAIAREVRRLRGQVDVLVVLSHLGITKDRLLAEQLEGIDLIIGAHTHHLLEEPLLVNRTYLAAAGKYGGYLGHLVVTVDREAGSVSVEGGCLPADTLPADPAVEELIAGWREVAERSLSRVVARLDRPLGNGWRTESPLGNRLAAALRRWVGAEAAVLNAGQLLEGLPEGDVTKGDLLRICPSPVNPCRYWLKGADLQEALELALTDEYRDKPLAGFGFRGKVLGTLCLDGIDVRYEPGLPEGQRIRFVSIQGEPLDPERLYRMGSLDMFTFGAGYSPLGRGTETEYFLPEFLRDVLEADLAEGGERVADTQRHWFALKGRS